MTLPALNAAGAAITIDRIAPFQSAGVSIDYRARGPDGPERNRRALCMFAASGFQVNKQELVSLSTDGRRINGGELHMLKRFWLETNDAVLADPGAPKDAAALLLPRGLAITLQQIIGALPSTTVYALLAAAYALIYGLIGRINLAFGEFAALGGIAAVTGISIASLAGGDQLALSLAAGLATALFVSVFHGMVTGQIVLKPLARARGQHVLVATAGLALVLQEYMRLAQGAGTRWVPPVLSQPVALASADAFTLTITPVAAGVTAAGALAIALLLLALNKTSFGLAWRAASQDPRAAELFGVSLTGIYLRTFALACGLAGLAGFIMAVFYGGIGFSGGTFLGLKALAGAVAGGIGSVPGAILGGLLLGAAEAAWSSLMPIETRDIAIFSGLALLIALRPGGLFGYAELEPRQI